MFQPKSNISLETMTWPGTVKTSSADFTNTILLYVCLPKCATNTERKYIKKYNKNLLAQLITPIFFHMFEPTSWGQQELYINNYIIDTFLHNFHKYKFWLC
jgi:hypothetical protein